MKRFPMHVMLALLLFIGLAGAVSMAQTKQGANATTLRMQSVHTRHLTDNAVTTAKLAIVNVAATVTAAGTAVTTAADPTLVGGQVLAVVNNGNQDQFISTVVVNANGSVTLTLKAAATANNVFIVKVLKALGT